MPKDKRERELERMIQRRKYLRKKQEVDAVLSLFRGRGPEISRRAAEDLEKRKKKVFKQMR